MPSFRLMMVMESTAGGTARYLEQVVSRLAAEDVMLHVVCSTRRASGFLAVVQRFRDAGIDVSELDMVRNLSFVRDATAVSRLRQLLHRTQPDIVHLHSSKAGALGRIAAAMARFEGALVYSPHAFAFLDPVHVLRSRIYFQAERFLARWTDILAAVSASEAAAAAVFMPAARIRIAPNGIDPVPRSAGRRQRRRHDRLILGSLGRMEEQKNPLQLIELAAMLRAGSMNFELHLAGSGVLHPQLVNRARELGLEARVLFAGEVENPIAFYTTLDVFVLTSHYEGLPYSVMDAMAAGLPVIAYDVPGVRDLVEPGVTGLLCPASDLRSLVESVHQLDIDPERARRMGDAGAARIHTEFTLDQQVRALMRIYHECTTTVRGSPVC